MARYGKTLKEEMRVSGGAEEEFFVGSPGSSDAQTSKSPVLAVVVLGIGFILLVNGRWIAAIVAFVVFAILLIRRAPSGAFYQNSDE